MVETTSIVSVTSTITGTPYIVTDYGKINLLNFSYPLTLDTKKDANNLHLATTTTITTVYVPNAPLYFPPTPTNKPTRQHSPARHSSKRENRRFPHSNCTYPHQDPDDPSPNDDFHHDYRFSYLDENSHDRQTDSVLGAWVLIETRNGVLGRNSNWVGDDDLIPSRLAI